MRQDGWKGKRVLVTGAGGFIASHLVERLLREGARVRAFVRYNSRDEAGYLREVKEREGLEIMAGDLRNVSTVEQAVEGMEVVFHLGAVISIPYSYVNPVEVVESNVLGTLNVLHGVQEVGSGAGGAHVDERGVWDGDRMYRSLRATRYRGRARIRRARSGRTSWRRAFGARMGCLS